MTRIARNILVVSLLAATLPACSGFDIDKLDVFGLSEKKKLPGERRALFPDGVPGVQQGIPPELMKGAAPQGEAATAEASLPAEPQRAEPAPKPKPKRVARRAPQATPVSAQPAAARQQPADDAVWPAPPSGGQSQQTQQNPWPSAPPPAGTFSR